MDYKYDVVNIFAKILRAEIPCSKVLETEFSLAFNDINPRAPHHILVIPKGPYVNFDHFILSARNEEILDFNSTISSVIIKIKVDPCNGGKGYRLITNSGLDGVQEVPHFHVHILGGRPLGGMLS